jgi:hypothetical protein
MINSIVVYDKIAECLSVSPEFVKLSKNDAILTPSQAVAVFASLFEISGIKSTPMAQDPKPMILAAVLRELGINYSDYSNGSWKHKTCVLPRVYAAIIMLRDYGMPQREVYEFFEKRHSFISQVVYKYMELVEEDRTHRVRFEAVREYVKQNV